MRMWGAAKKLSAWLGVVFLLLGCEASVGVRDIALVRPANDSTLVVAPEACDGSAPKTVTFSWTAVRNAISYRVDVYNATNELVAHTVAAGATNTSATISWTEPGCPATYSWRVTAIRNSPSTPIESAVWRFTVTAGTVSPPRLLSPPDGANIECLAPDNGWVNFDWTDVPNATNYTLEVYKAADGALFLSRTVTASQSTETVVCRPELALSYRWRVAANVGGQSVWSGFSTFTMTVEKPFLVSPPNGSSVAVGAAACAGTDGPDPDSDPDPVRIQFTWTVVLNATSYRVDVFNDATNALVASTVTGATSATISWLTDASRPCPGTYRWQVTAIKSLPNPPVTSDPWRFTLAP